MIELLRQWIEHRRAIRCLGRKMPGDLLQLTRSTPVRRRSEGAARSQAQGNAGDYRHWAEVASEVARIEPRADMDFEVVKAIADQETTGRS